MGGICLMKVNSGWNYRPYQPLNHLKTAFKPYICRLAPFRTGTEVQLLDNGCPGAKHIVKVRPRGTPEPWQSMTVEGPTCIVDGLVSGIDYEIVAEREGEPEQCSKLRLFRTGEYPGRVVNYLHPDDNQYAFSGNMLGNPCIVKLPSGTLLSSMDLFTGQAPQNLELIFRSKDGGKTWEYVTDLFPCYWGTLFLHRGVLYILATATEFGDILVGASYDEGETWTRPVRLFPGSGMFKRAGWQRQPMPILNYGGKLMTSIEYGSWWESDLFGIHTLWVDEDADLLDPASWNVSEGTHFDKSWSGSPKGGNPALLEGNLYVDRRGKVINLLRMSIAGSCDPDFGLACILELDMDNLDAAPKFNSIIEMPTGSNSKTYILYDPVSDKYWGIGNYVNNPKTPSMRSIAALVVSDDGYDWRIAKILFDYSNMDAHAAGMQYHHFIIEGNDLLWLSRTAFNNPRNFHDSNCQTFHIIENFRDMDRQGH